LLVVLSALLIHGVILAVLSFADVFVNRPRLPSAFSLLTQGGALQVSLGLLLLCAW